MRGGQENKKAADGGERAKARRSPGTTKGSSWPAPRAGLSRVFYLPQQSDGKAAISGHHPQPATARPVDHRLTLDPCGLAYSLLRPCASTPKVVPAQGWTTGLMARVSGPARRDEMGRAGRPGPAGEGLARDETASARRSREHRPDQLGWRPACRPEPGTRPEGGRPKVTACQFSRTNTPADVSAWMNSALTCSGVTVPSAKAMQEPAACQ